MFLLNGCGYFSLFSLFGFDIIQRVLNGAADCFCLLFLFYGGQFFFNRFFFGFGFCQRIFKHFFLGRSL